MQQRSKVTFKYVLILHGILCCRMFICQKNRKIMENFEFSKVTCARLTKHLFSALHFFPCFPSQNEMVNSDRDRSSYPYFNTKKYHYLTTQITYRVYKSKVLYNSVTIRHEKYLLNSSQG